MKSAGAYLRNGRIFLHPDSKTIKGFWIASEPVMATDEDDKDLGTKILWILSQSTVDVPDPASRAAPKALLKAANARTYEEFADLTKCIEIEFDGRELVFTPSRNGGPRRRFSYLKEKIRCPPSEADAAKFLREAFDACEW